MKKGRLLLSYRKDVEGWKDGESGSHASDWRTVKNRLTQIMTDVNPTSKWESPDYPWERFNEYSDEEKDVETKPIDPLSMKFTLRNADDLTQRLLVKRPWPDSLDIYEYGKQGLLLSFLGIPVDSDELQREMNITMVAACKKWFYRDWKRGGICVETTREHPRTAEEEMEWAERENDRAMRKNVEDRGWPYDL